MVDPLLIFVHDNPVVSATLLTFSGLLGFLINGFILFKIACHKVYAGSFGWIWISRSIAFSVSSSMTMVLMGFGSLLFPNILGVIGPAMILVGWIESVFSNFLIALNRCLLIARPFTFKRTFSNQNTVIFIALTWLLSFAFVLAALYFPCVHEEQPGSLFSIQPSLSCDYTFTVFTYGPMWIAIAMCLAVDVYSILVLHRMNKVRDKLAAHALSPQYRAKILRLCYMLACQCFIGPLIMFIVTIGDDIANPLLNFLMTAFLLSIADSIDGAIVIAFNKDLQTVGNSRRSLTETDSSGAQKVDSVKKNVSVA